MFWFEMYGFRAPPLTRESCAMGTKMITHTYYYLEINFPITQDICYTGLSGRNSFVQLGRFHKVLSVNVPITHITVRVKIITGSLVTLENLFTQSYRYRYRLETQMNLFNYHYCYRLGVRSHTFISIDSQSPS